MLQNTLKHIATLLLIGFSFIGYSQQNVEKEDFFIDVNVGVTQRITGEITKSQFNRQITQTVTNGMQYGIAGYYKTKFLPNTSLGLKYVLNTYDGEENNVSLDLSGNGAETGLLKNKSSINYIAIGALFSFSFGSKAKNELFFEPSVGYFHYNQEIEINTKQTIKGGNIGFSVDLGYLRNLSKHFSAGLKFGYFNANLETYTIDNGITKQEIEAERVEAIVLSNLQSNFILRYQL